MTTPFYKDLLLVFIKTAHERGQPIPTKPRLAHRISRFFFVSVLLFLFRFRFLLFFLSLFGDSARLFIAQPVTAELHPFPQEKKKKVKTAAFSRFGIVA